MTPEACVEHVREAIPLLAQPIQPGENVPVWMARAARRCGLQAGRLMAYWHRKVAQPKAHEYLAIIGAADAEIRRRQAIAELEGDIAKRAAALVAERDRIARDHPILGRLLRAVPEAAPTRPDEARHGSVAAERAIDDWRPGRRA